MMLIAFFRTSFYFWRLPGAGYILPGWEHRCRGTDHPANPISADKQTLNPGKN